MDIEFSRHILMQMQRRGVTLGDIALTLQFGNHVVGLEPGTYEACTRLDDKPLTVVYSQERFDEYGIFYVVTVIRRMCG